MVRHTSRGSSKRGINLRILFDILTVTLIGTTSWLIAVRYIASAIRWLALQSFLLALFTAGIALTAHKTDLYWVAGITLAIKAIAIPAILYRVMKRVGLDRQTQVIAGRDRLMLGVLAMWLIGYYVTPHIAGSVGHTPYLAVAIGMLLSGVLIMIVHEKAIMQGIGLIVIENGLFLAALSTSFGMPFLVDVGVSLDVLVIVMLMAILTLRMDEQFSSMHIDKLRRLRG